MSSKIFTPINQVKLTNVSVVRLKKGGKRFELACYRNKVQDYRNKVYYLTLPSLLLMKIRTKDLDEVLQVHSVFLNVSKGQTAKESDLLAGFGTADVEKVILEILTKGELQVGSEERGAQMQMMTREVATIVADKCVNPRTKTPYPVGVIEQAMGEMHFSPNLTKNSKQQALDVIRALEKQDKFPIARAQMRLQIEVPMGESKRFDETVRPLLALVEQEKRDDGDKKLKVVTLIDPGQFRAVNEKIAHITKGRGSVTLLSLKDLRESSPSTHTGIGM